MKLIYGTYWTQVQPLDRLDLIAIERALVHPDDNSKSLFDSENYRFPTGLTALVCRRLKNMQTEFTIEGAPTLGPQLEIPLDILPGISIRAHQAMASQKLIMKKRGIAHIATSGGKTEIQGIVQKLLDRPGLILLDRIKALRQTRDRLQKYGIKCYLFGEEEPVPGAKLVLGMVQTFYSGLKRGDQAVMDLLQDAEVVQFDECHHLATSYSWQSIARQCTKAEWMLGYSGTPFRGDRPLEEPEIADMTLLGILGEPVCYVPSWYLREQGYAAELLIYMIPISKPSFYHLGSNSSYDKIYKVGIEQNVTRNTVIATLAVNLANLGYRPLITVRLLEHGRTILKLIHERGVSVKFSSGGDVIQHVGPDGIIESSDPENNVKDEFQRGDLQILIGSSIYVESQDIPEITALIHTSAGRSPIETLQRIGRAARVHEGKSYALVFDFNDQTHFWLAAQSKKRAAEYVGDRYEVRHSAPPEFMTSLGVRK